MKEYIEREAVRDLMERALEDDWEIQYAKDRLSDIPAADVVEVVRCKDCKWKPRNMGCNMDSEKLNFPLDSESCVICPYGSDDPWYNREPDPNGFCSLGERKEGADDETIPL